MQCCGSETTLTAADPKTDLVVVLDDSQSVRNYYLGAMRGAVSAVAGLPERPEIRHGATVVMNGCNAVPNVLLSKQRNFWGDLIERNRRLQRTSGGRDTPILGTLANAVDALKTSDAPNRAIILVSDGCATCLGRGGVAGLRVALDSELARADAEGIEIILVHPDGHDPDPHVDLRDFCDQRPAPLRCIPGSMGSFVEDFSRAVQASRCSVPLHGVVPPTAELRRADGTVLDEWAASPASGRVRLRGAACEALLEDGELLLRW